VESDRDPFSTSRWQWSNSRRDLPNRVAGQAPPLSTSWGWTSGIQDAFPSEMNCEQELGRAWLSGTAEPFVVYLDLLIPASLIASLPFDLSNYNKRLPLSFFPQRIHAPFSYITTPPSFFPSLDSDEVLSRHRSARCSFGICS